MFNYSFLDDSKIIPDKDGQYDVQITFSIKSSNPQDLLFFYLVEDNNGIIDIETDTETEIESLSLRFFGPI
jgi:hypothetical protein